MLVSRLFNTHDDAMSAVGDLKQVGFRDASIRIIDKTDSEVTAASLQTHGVTQERTHHYADSVNQGSTLVIVDAPVGAGVTAKSILDRPRAGDSGTPEAEYEVAAGRANGPTAASGVKDPATPLSSWLNWPVLLNEPAPLSKWLNMRVLSDPPTAKPTSHGLPFLSNNATPLSSRLGMRVLSDNPTPLSTKLGRQTLLDNAAPFSSWLGRRVLLDNPTPLSSWLGWPVLVGEKPKHAPPSEPPHSEPPQGRLSSTSSAHPSPPPAEPPPAAADPSI